MTMTQAANELADEAEATAAALLRVRNSWLGTARRVDDAIPVSPAFAEAMRRVQAEFAALRSVLEEVQ